MPSIAEFLGMWITINWMDHPPPHIHVEAGEFSALVRIKDGVVISGKLPPSKLKYLKKWITMHQSELMENWQLAQARKPLHPIEGL
jgi:hypothetical protein